MLIVPPEGLTGPTINLDNVLYLKYSAETTVETDYIQSSYRRIEVNPYIRFYFSETTFVTWIASDPTDIDIIPTTHNSLTSAITHTI
jgi:hypothetical protein